MSNPNSAKNPYTTILTLFLIGLILVLAIGLNKQYSKKQTENTDLHEQNSILLEQLSESEQQRDSLVSVINHLNHIDSILTRDLNRTRRELSSIKGRYKDLSPDSLAKEMNRRANAE
jgi:cell division septum initiation protein DivIVA